MKKIVKNIYRLSLIALLGFVPFSCGDQFLDFDPVAAENSASFYIRMDQADQAVAAAYSTLVARTCWDRNILLDLGEVPSPDAESGGDYENEVPEVEVFNRHEPLPTSGTLADVYGNLFRGIHFSNLALENIPNVLEADPNADPNIINLRLAEVKFLRALNYLYLTHVFGQVPLVDHVLAPSEYFMDKVDMGQIFDLIEKDLTEAIPVLPEKSSLSVENTGRATKGAAKALLARMYIFESSYAKNYSGDERFGDMSERWQDVLDVCEEIITSGEYSLVGYNGETFETWRGAETNGYAYMFTVEGENNSESIFEIQYINDNVDYTLTRAGSLVQWCSARYCSIDGVQQQTGYWGLGWPTQLHVDQYEAGDVRLNTNVSTPGDSIEIAGGTRYPVNFDNSATGYYLKKYELSAEQFSDAGGHGWQKSPFNYKLLRYADVLLMAAEAAIELGDNDKAALYINEVRIRARACGGGTVPANLTGTITLEQLIRERRVELAFEGRRYFDMVRWGIADDEINGSTTAEGYPITYVSPKNDFQPLPQREIISSQGGLTQNVGW
ncbi:MAG: RagB/SusD family nutrient uptake outer membrane protein [Bacteroidales bacterium]|nr:RagB/SusD family nutrient uptake outer membrane protein [Bacteroidales bacterium]